MTDTTPTYELPFQDVNDAPDGPSLSEDLALAVEAELVRIDAAIATMNAMTHAIVSSSTDDSTTSTSFIPGSSPVGVTFVAPPSGVVFVTLTSYFGQTTNQKEAIVSFTVRTGGTVGSGTTVGSGANGDKALVCGMAVLSGAPARLQASRRSPVTGLTPGSTYNARIEFASTSGGGCEVFYRELLIEPAL